MSKIWATGCSNGGVFTFELAQNERTSKYIAGIAPMVSLPLYGHNFGPFTPTHLFGSWGIHDPLVNPIWGGDPDFPDRSQVLPMAYTYFATADAVTAKWADAMSCGEKRTRPSKFEMNESCWQYRNCEGGAKVIGCLFTYYPKCRFSSNFIGNFLLNFFDHNCYSEFQILPMLDFMYRNSKPIPSPDIGFMF